MGFEEEKVGDASLRGEARPLRTTNKRLFGKYARIFIFLVGGALLTSGAVDLVFSYQDQSHALARAERQRAEAASVMIERFIQNIEQNLQGVAKNRQPDTSAGLAQRQLNYNAFLKHIPSVTDIAGGTKAVKAAKSQTTTIPIVMTNSGDAVGTGLVDSLARPGGNVTGSTQMSPQLSGKRMELLKEAVPNLSKLAVLWNKDHANTTLMFAEIEKVAPQLGLEVQTLEISAEKPDFEGAFEAAITDGAEVVLVLRDPLIVKNQQQITDLATEKRLPVMYETTNFIDAGGLMIYGPSFKALYKRAATYTHKILNGANPSEMPVEHPIAFDLVINLDAAEAIGVTFPDSFMNRATETVRN